MANSYADYLRPVNDNFTPNVQPLAGQGNPPHDGGMEARVAKLEASMEHVHETLKDIKVDVREIRTSSKTDFRLLFGALIAVAVGLAALMAHGFKWI